MSTWKRISIDWLPGKITPYLATCKRGKWASLAWGDGNIAYPQFFPLCIDEEHLDIRLRALWDRLKTNNQLHREASYASGYCGELSYWPVSSVDEASEIVREEFADAGKRLRAALDATAHIANRLDREEAIAVALESLGSGLH